MFLGIVSFGVVRQQPEQTCIHRHEGSSYVELRNLPNTPIRNMDQAGLLVNGGSVCGDTMSATSYAVIVPDRPDE